MSSPYMLNIDSTGYMLNIDSTGSYTKAQVPVLWAGATSLILILYSFAFLRGYGRKASVPSLLNRNYSLGLLSALGAIWAIAAVWCAVRLRAVAERNNLAPEPPPATET